MSDQTIIVTATFIAEPIKDSLRFFLDNLGIKTVIEFAAYNQVFQQLLDPSSLTSGNFDGINVVLIRLEDWGKSVSGTDENDVSLSVQRQSIERSVREFVGAIKSAVARSGAPYVVVCCPRRAAISQPAFSDFLERMEVFLDSELRNVRGVYYVSPQQLQRTYSVLEYDDPRSDLLGCIPYTPLFFNALGAMVARSIYQLRAAPHKVIVLDCDQTLWKGVCGEDGTFGIEIDESRRALQNLMMEQHRSGMLLCLCSKNNEEDVWDVFERRLEMPLRREHIVSSRINWKPKSENLRSLAAELNLGLDSFIFIDDDPSVCAEVCVNCPEVLTLQLPGEADEIIPCLNNFWALDRSGMTAEDESRTSLYRVAAERERMRATSKSLDDFLAGLCLEITVSSLRAEDVARVSQLTQRTNQFNFTTIRRSETEIEQLCLNGEAECLVVTVVDRFGDYGLVGTTIFRTGKNALEVDSLLLSCRALGRRVEHRMLAELGRIAQARNLDYVDVCFRHTKKNRPAFEFIRCLESTGSTTDDGSTILRIKSQVAAAVESQAISSTNTQKAVLESPEVTATNDNHNTLSTTSFLCHIAAELRTPQQISAAVISGNAESRVLAEPFVRPGNEEEEQLKAIWEDCLCVKPIGVNDNYFELGGDSFQAVRVFVEIETSFGIQLPLATLLEAPTIRQLAEQVRQSDQKNRWSSLVPLQPNGSRPPLYCIHAAGGNVLFYRDLARHLGPNQPLYGLQARGLKRGQTHHNSVKEMAAYYISEIQALQPHGPYYLGGSSFGGLVAFEMARQIESAGESVALLALFDTYGPGYPKLKGSSSTWKSLIRSWSGRVRAAQQTLQLLDGEAKREFIRKKLRQARKQIFRRYKWKKNEIAIAFNAATGRPLPEDLQRNQRAIDQALRTYKPQPYGGVLTLFRAANQPIGVIKDDTLGWAGLADGGIETCEVPGSHGAVTVDPHAKFLAEALTPCILNAQMHSAKVQETGRTIAAGVYGISADKGPILELENRATI